MFKFKDFTFVILCLAILVCDSCIYASDVNGTASDMSQHLYDNNTCGSFVELKGDIQKLNAGDVYDIQKDYCFADNSSIDSECITICADNITINGNYHCLNGNNHSVTFKITSNNVKILNLTICNCQGFGEDLKITIEGNPLSTSYSTCMSLVNWKGDNGTIENCIFIGNSAVNGGAIAWSGDNGIINNARFINNSASGAGGSVYISGRNDMISNAIFINSTSQLINEAVYLDRKHDSVNFNNITCDNMFCLNGTMVGADVNNLRKTYYSQFAGENINLIPMIYSSLFTLQPMNSNIYYFGVFSSELQTYTLSLIKNFDECGITYENDYVISAKDLNDVFSCLMSDQYTVNFKIVKTCNVNNLNDYLDVCHVEYNKDVFNVSWADIVEKDMNNVHNFRNITKVLNVNFKNNSYFASNEQWIENKWFDIIMINGNGALIHATSGVEDEYKWLVHETDNLLIINNLAVSGFNTAIDNVKGHCILNNVSLFGNKMEFEGDGDGAAIHNSGVVICNNCLFNDNCAHYGGAIYNEGIVICNNCSFDNNHADYGGAICNEGLLSLNNCTFDNNTILRGGTNVFNIGSAKVFVDGEQINGTKDVVTYVKSSPSITFPYAVFGTLISFSLVAIAAGITAIIVGGLELPVILVAGITLFVAVGMEFFIYFVFLQ